MTHKNADRVSGAGIRKLRLISAALLAVAALALGTVAAASAGIAAAEAPAYAVKVDGVTAVLMADREEALAMLNAILERYSAPEGGPARFEQQVVLERCTAREEDLEGPEAARAKLDPENSGSPWALTVVAEGVRTQHRAVPYDTQTLLVEDGYSDEVELAQAGRDGQALDVYAVTYENGRERSQVLVSSRITEEPVAEVISQGALPGSRTDSRGCYIWPTTGVLTSKYGGRNVTVGSSNHKGIDIGNSLGTDVVAADGGDVISAGFNKGGYGNLIQIRHDDGTVTYYGHLDEILVSEGDRVAQGQLIGRMGRTGQVSGTHLHFEIRVDGAPVDPLPRLTGDLQRG